MIRGTEFFNYLIYDKFYRPIVSFEEVKKNKFIDGYLNEYEGNTRNDDMEYSEDFIKNDVGQRKLKMKKIDTIVKVLCEIYNENGEPTAFIDRNTVFIIKGTAYLNGANIGSTK